MGSQAPRIFISYARADAKQVAREIQNRLEVEHGFSLWRDLSDLEGGSDWQAEVERAIDAVEFLVLVVTPCALESSIVEWEWRYARRSGTCVLPVIGDENLDLGELPRWMRRRSLVDMREPEQWARMIRTLEGPCRTPRAPRMVRERAADFVPRPDVVEVLKDLLLEDDLTEPISTTIALKGPGGFGKTTVCTELCHDADVESAFDDGVLWVTTGPGSPTLIDLVGDLIETLTGSRASFRTLDASRARLAELIADRRILFVIDDVWEAAHLEPFLVGGSKCAFLITTRRSDAIPPGTRTVQIDCMEPEQSLTLLQYGLPSSTSENLRGLVDRLGGWPLALKLVNGVLRSRILESGQPSKDAVDRINEGLDRRGLVAFDPREPRAREQAVGMTIGLSLERLGNDEASRFEELAVFPWDQDVPVAVVGCFWSRTNALTGYEVEELLRRLFALSLISDLDLRASRVSLHQVLAKYLRIACGTRLASLHAELVEVCGENHERDSGIAEYFQRNLADHLYASGMFDKLVDLPSEEWRQVKRRHLGSNTSFLRDLDVAARGAKCLPFERAIPQLVKIAAMKGRVHNADQQLPEGALETMPLLGDLQRALERIRPPIMPYYEAFRRAEIIRGLSGTYVDVDSPSPHFAVAIDGLVRTSLEPHPGSRSYLVRATATRCE